MQVVSWELLLGLGQDGVFILCEGRFTLFHIVLESVLHHLHSLLYCHGWRLDCGRRYRFVLEVGDQRRVLFLGDDRGRTYDVVEVYLGFFGSDVTRY